MTSTTEPASKKRRKQMPRDGDDEAVDCQTVESLVKYWDRYRSPKNKDAASPLSPGSSTTSSTTAPPTPTPPPSPQTKAMTSRSYACKLFKELNTLVCDETDSSPMTPEDTARVKVIITTLRTYIGEMKDGAPKTKKMEVLATKEQKLDDIKNILQDVKTDIKTTVAEPLHELITESRAFMSGSVPEKREGQSWCDRHTELKMAKAAQTPLNEAIKHASLMAKQEKTALKYVVEENVKDLKTQCAAKKRKGGRGTQKCADASTA